MCSQPSGACAAACCRKPTNYATNGQRERERTTETGRERQHRHPQVRDKWLSCGNLVPTCHRAMTHFTRRLFWSATQTNYGSIYLHYPTVPPYSSPLHLLPPAATFVIEKRSWQNGGCDFFNWFNCTNGTFSSTLDYFPLPLLLLL